MKGRVIADWTKIGNITDPKTRLQVMGALQHFMSAPDRPEVRAAMQHFATTGDFPTSVLEVLEKYGLEASYDEGWRSIFDVRDFTGSNRNGFQILDVEHGLSFAKVKEGEKAKIYKMAGEKVTVNFDMYGAGLGWHRTLFDDREYWTLEDNARAFRNQAGHDRAAIYYALIEALPSTYDVAWQAPVPAALATTNDNYTAVRDMQTMVAACEAIITRLKDLGMGVTTNTPFTLLAPMQLISRVRRAIGILNSGISGSHPGVPFNINPVFTQMLTTTNKYYVCVPKLKAKAGIRMNLTVFDQFDPTSYSDIAVGWERHGGAIGEIKQFSRCATA